MDLFVFRTENFSTLLSDVSDVRLDGKFYSIVDRFSFDFLSSYFPHRRPSFFHTKFKRQQYLRYVLEIIVDRIVEWVNPRSWYLFHFGNYLRDLLLSDLKTSDVNKKFFLFAIHSRALALSFIRVCHPHIYTHAVIPVFPPIHSCNNFCE